MKLLLISVIFTLLSGCIATNKSSIHTIVFSYDNDQITVTESAPCLQRSDYLKIHFEVFDAMSKKDQKHINIVSDLKAEILCPSKVIKKLISFESTSSPV